MSVSIISKPQQGEYPAYCEGYNNYIRNNNLIKVLEDSILNFQSIVTGIPEGKENFRYAPEKWSIKEVIGHIIDTERVLAYRVLCIARGEQYEMPGFDENAFVENANTGQRTMYDLVHEFSLVREANILMFKSFNDEILSRKGIANKHTVSVKGLIFMIAGHELHHLNVIKTKYLPELI